MNQQIRLYVFSWRLTFSLICTVTLAIVPYDGEVWSLRSSYLGRRRDIILGRIKDFRISDICILRCIQVYGGSGV